MCIRDSSNTDIRRVFSRLQGTMFSGKCLDCTDMEVIIEELATQEGEFIKGTFSGLISNVLGETERVEGMFNLRLRDIIEAWDITGTLWLDDNEDGIRNNGEGPFDRRQGIFLLDPDRNVVDEVLSDESGSYRFENIVPEQYQISVTFPLGNLTQLDAGADDCADSDLDPTTSSSDVFTLESSDLECMDIGFTGPVQLDCDSLISFTRAPCDTLVIFDIRIPVGPLEYILIHNGQGFELLGGDQLILHVPPSEHVFELYNGNQLLCTKEYEFDPVSTCSIATTETNCNGGQVSTTVTGFTCTGPAAVTYLWSDGSTLPIPPPFELEGTYSVTVTDVNGCSSVSTIEVDFSDYTSIRGILWQDNTSGTDGLYEPGLDVIGTGETIVLIDSDGTTVLDSTLTDAEGFYSFEDLELGRSYFIQYELPAGFEFSPAAVGNDEALNSNVDPATQRAEVELRDCNQNLNINIGYKEI